MDAYSESESVEKRHRSKHFISRTEHRIARNYLLRQCIEVEVGQNDSLGGSCGSPGVQDGCRIIGRAFYLILISAVASYPHEIRPLEHRSFSRDPCDLAPFCHHVSHFDRSCELIPDTGNDDILDLGVGTDRFDLVIELVERNYHDAARHVEIILDLLLRRQRVDHVGHRSDEVGRVQHIYSLRTVRHRDRDPVILPDAEDSQRPGTQVDLIDHILICNMLAHEIKSDRKRMLLRDLLDLLIHGAVEILKCERQVSPARFPWRLYSLRDREDYLFILIKSPVVSIHPYSFFPIYSYLSRLLVDGTQTAFILSLFRVKDHPNGIHLFFIIIFYLYYMFVIRPVI